MDFKPLKKDRKPGPDGLFGWESPRLKAALKAAKEAGKGMVATGLTSTISRSMKDVDMLAKDLGAVHYASAKNCEREQAAFEEWVVKTRPWGDVDAVQHQWSQVRDEWLENE